MKKLIAAIMMFLAMVGMVAMYLSNRFIPVYVNGKYILANQLMRYALYFVLVGVIMYCFAYVISGPSSKKKHKKRPRRR